MSETGDELDACLAHLDANYEAEYQTAVEDLKNLITTTKEASRDSVFEICHNADKSVLQFIAAKLQARGWRADLRYNEGANDWARSTPCLSVKPPPLRIMDSKDFSVHDCFNK